MSTNTFHWSQAGQQDNSNYKSYVKNRDIWLDWFKKKNILKNPVFKMSLSSFNVDPMRLPTSLKHAVQ